MMLTGLELPVRKNFKRIAQQKSKVKWEIENLYQRWMSGFCYGIEDCPGTFDAVYEDPALYEPAIPAEKLDDFF